MKCISKVLMGLAGAALVALSAVKPGEANSDGGEDRSCETVNIAYAATVNAILSSVRAYAEQEDGSLVLTAEVRTKLGTSYQKEPTSEHWVRYRQSKWVPVDAFGPKITDCVFMGDTSDLGVEAKHYSGIRYEGAQRSKVDFWITQRDGRIAKMLIGPWGVKLKSGLGQIELWKFDDEALPPPF